MNRRILLAALLAMLLAACGTQADQSDDESTATLTPEPTTEATASPSDEAAESEDDNGGVTGSLDDLIPDEVNGVAGTALPGMEQIFSAALQGQGLNAGDAEFAFVTAMTAVKACNRSRVSLRLPRTKGRFLATCSRWRWRHTAGWRSPFHEAQGGRPPRSESRR